MSDYIVDSADLTSVANAIRTKGGTSAQLAFPAGFVSAIENIPSGGASGLTLLGSGTYTKTSDSASISIPVTYTGTPKEWFYYHKNPDKTIQQTVLGFRRLIDNDADLSSMMPNGIYCHWLARNGSIVAASQPQAVTLSATEMTSTRPGSGNTHKAGTWIWAIYGEEAT